MHGGTARARLNIYAPFTADSIQKALTGGVQLPPLLQEQLDWSKAVASVITEGLKGNPRQVKRMLNALSLRKQLAAIAKISIREEVLAKLMVFRIFEPAAVSVNSISGRRRKKVFRRS